MFDFPLVSTYYFYRNQINELFFMNEMCRSDLEHVGYSERQIKLIDDFLTMLCQPAHGYVVNIFVSGRNKSFAKIMLARQVAWHTVWKYGTPGRLGDADDVAYPNWKAITGIYEALGMSCPKTL